MVVSFLLLKQSNADEFSKGLSGWGEFKFGEDIDKGKQVLEKDCKLVTGYFGRECKRWLNLEINIRLSTDEGNFFGFGKKLTAMQLTTPFSPDAGNVILRHLRKKFTVTTDYTCWFKLKDTHRCKIVFDNGLVIFFDKKSYEDREITVAFNPHPFLY